jgi:hypothetical protein
MNISKKRKIRGLLVDIKPFIEENILVAESEFFAGRMPEYTYKNIVARHKIFMEYFFNWTRYTIPLGLCYIAPILIDLRNLQDTLNGEELLKVKDKESQIIKIFNENGFSNTHPSLGFPIKLH